MAAIFADPDRVGSFTDGPDPVGGGLQRRQRRYSGPGSDLEMAVARLSADGVRCDWLDTSHAFHSALLDPALDEFESYANSFESAPPQRILVCNRTGAALGRNAVLDGSYWRRHARQPVEFAKGVATLAELGVRHAARGGSTTGAHRRGPAGLAGPGERTEGDPVAAPQPG